MRAQHFPPKKKHFGGTHELIGGEAPISPPFFICQIMLDSPDCPPHPSPRFPKLRHCLEGTPLRCRLPPPPAKQVQPSRSSKCHPGTGDSGSPRKGYASPKRYYYNRLGAITHLRGTNKSTKNKRARCISSPGRVNGHTIQSHTHTRTRRS